MVWSDVKGDEILHFVQDDNPRICHSKRGEESRNLVDLWTEAGEVIHVS